MEDPGWKIDRNLKCTFLSVFLSTNNNIINIIRLISCGYTHLAKHFHNKFLQSRIPESFTVLQRNLWLSDEIGHGDLYHLTTSYDQIKFSLSRSFDTLIAHLNALGSLSRTFVRLLLFKKAK